MKTTLRSIVALAAFVFSLTLAAQDFTAGINTETPNPNAVLHLVAPNGDQGLLIPNLTTAQRTSMSLTATDNGLMVFDSDESAFYFWVDPNWVVMNNTDNQNLANVLNQGNDAGGFGIVNVADPVNAQDVATKNYVDTQAESDPTVPANIKDGVDYTELTGIPANIDIDNTDDVTETTLPATGDIEGNFQSGLNIAIGAVSALEIQDGTIQDADIGGSANIAASKLDANVMVQGENISLLTNDAGFIAGETQTLGAVVALGNDAGGSVISNVANPIAAQDVATRDYVDTQGFITGETQTLGAVVALGNDAGGSVISNVANPVAAQDVATRDYVDTQGFITGETQTLGAVVALGNDAGGSVISNVANPLAAQDVATRDYVDTQGFITGETQTLGAVVALGNDAGGSVISNVANPVAAQDVATRDYVDTQGFITGETQTLGAVVALGNDAGGSVISNVANPLAAQDVATRDYVDTQGFITGETQTLGAVVALGNDAGGSVISNVANPVAAQDVATRDYVDTQGFITGETQTLGAVVALGNDAGNSVLSNVADPVLAQDVATRNYVDTQGFITGETQTLGAVVALGNDAGGSVISNVANPVAAQDVATRDYVDTQGFITGETQTLGAVVALGNDAGNSVLSNVADPVLAQDVATRNYVDTQGFITGETQTLGAVVALGNDAGGSIISNVANPVAAQDVATRDYVDTQGFITGETQTLGAVIALGNDAGNSVISNVADPVLAQDVATRNYVDTQGFITGETQTLGSVVALGNDAGGSVISNVANPVAAQDVATRDYVDTQGFITGETQTLGAVIALGNDAGNSVISNVANPVAAQDVATRDYVDTQGFITGETQTLGSVVALGNDAGGSVISNVANPVAAQDVATRDYVDTQGFITGETQTLGSVVALGNDAGGSVISNVANPVAAQDVATRDYVDTQGFITGETQTLGAVVALGNDAGGSVISNVANPVAAQDVATRDYVDTSIPAPLVSGNGVTVGGSTVDLGGTLGGAATITTGAGSLDLVVNGAGVLDVDAIADFSANASFSSIDVTGGAIAGASLTQADNTFFLQDDGDASSRATFQLAGIATATTRQYILPDQDGTMALLSDIGAGDYAIDGNENAISSNSIAAPTGSNNIVLGFNSGPGLTTGSDNILIGTGADNSTSTTGGNVGIGNGADANGGDAIAIGTNAQADANNSVAVGTGTIANVANTIVLGDGIASDYFVGIGVRDVRAPLQIGGELAFGHFENVTEGIVGDAIISNAYPDYTNVTDNELRRSNADSVAFIFFDDGEIIFLNAPNGAANSALDLSNSGDVSSWLEMRNDGNIDIRGAIAFGDIDPGEEREGMIRWTGSNFEGNIDGSPGGWVSLSESFNLPFAPGPVADPTSLFSLDQTGGGSVARFNVNNNGHNGPALEVYSNGDGATSYLARFDRLAGSTGSGVFIDMNSVNNPAILIDNTTAPIQIFDGAGVGRVLTSDASGIGRWEPGFGTQDASFNLYTQMAGTGGALAASSGADNIFLGRTVGNGVNTGSGNVLLGNQVATGLTSGGANISIGVQSGGATLSDGSDNIFIGTRAILGGGPSNSTNNISIGTDASSTLSSVAIGHNAFSNAPGSVAIGNGARATTLNTVTLGDPAGTAYNLELTGNMISSVSNVTAAAAEGFTPASRMITLEASATISNIAAGSQGQEIIIITLADALIDEGGNIDLQIDPFNPGNPNSTLHLVYIGSQWVEISRTIK